MKNIDTEKQKGLNGDSHDVAVFTVDEIKEIIDYHQQEQPEVDIEKEIDLFVNWWNIDEFLGLVNDEGWSVTVGDIKNVARHFYELGLKARKENDDLLRYRCKTIPFYKER